MNYREQQRKRAVESRDKLFGDPGGGMYRGKERGFVLKQPRLNLWDGIRFDAIQYFQDNEITWWPGSRTEPSGHLLSSQIAGINHLFLAREKKGFAARILQGIDPEVQEAVIVDSGYVEFEFIGEAQYLKEKSFSRGQNCTSIDAVMIGKLHSGDKRLYAFEWKYTEYYSRKDLYIPQRAQVYDDLIRASDSPFVDSIDVRAYYYEPFYQLMRQTLLAHLCVKNNDHGVSSYKHVHVVSPENHALLNKITSPDFAHESTYDTIHDAWNAALREPNNFLATDPQELLRPINDAGDAPALIEYLAERYW